MVIIQKTFIEPKPTLYLVSTPIGNMLDLTFRALEILKKVDYILAEDTRRAYKILDFYQFKNNLISLFKYNEKKRVQKVLSFLAKNKQIALISDAGTPLISDPGLFLVQEVKKAGFYVTSVPGPSSFLSAFSISCFDIPFLFLGFLPKKNKHKTDILLKYRLFEGTLIMYESPARIKDTLKLIQIHYPQRNISLSRELTKKFETIINGDIDAVLGEQLKTKGEYVLVIEGNKKSFSYHYFSLDEHIMFFLQKGFSEKESFSQVAKARNISKKEIYRKYKIQKDNI
jgi:16S rRNA (cytidine1402-2'-O)-methyltransferase